MPNVKGDAERLATHVATASASGTWRATVIGNAFVSLAPPREIVAVSTTAVSVVPYCLVTVAAPPESAMAAVVSDVQVISQSLTLVGIVKFVVTALAVSPVANVILVSLRELLHATTASGSVRPARYPSVGDHEKCSLDFPFITFT